MIWKDIKGYENLYKINNTGEVMSIRRKKLLSPGITKSGYKFVTLSKNGKTKHFDVHRLVASTFIETNDFNLDVNHKDGNKLNNKVENLEWCTRSYNLKHALKLKLINSQCKIRRKVIISKEEKIIQFEDMKSCCNYFGFTKCWLGNYMRKNGNPCVYNGWEITVGGRYV